MTWPVRASVTRPVTVPAQKVKAHPKSGPKSNLHPAQSSIPASAAMLAVAFRDLNMDLPLVSLTPVVRRLATPDSALRLVCDFDGHAARGSRSGPELSTLLPSG